MEIGSVPAPLEWTHWKAAEAFLEPARVLGGFEAVIEPDEALWAVVDGETLLGCATARMCEGFVEIPLVGGRDFRRWIAELDTVIGAAAKQAGAASLLAMGRRGWAKILCARGWEVIGEMDGSTVYRREL
jgi:hypothetical protein